MLQSGKNKRKFSSSAPDRDFLIACYEKFVKLRRFGFNISDARHLSKLMDDNWFARARQLYLEE
jgi:hypothetical protein